MRTRHRVSKLLLRYGRVYEGSAWTAAHRRWLAGQCFTHEATELAYLDALAAADGLVARREVLDQRLSRLALEEPWWPTVARLRCFRGIDTLWPLALHLEVHDSPRFARAPQLTSWLGVTPSLHQSGENCTQGSSTQTGSSHARRLLVEAAKHYAHPPRRGLDLARRQEGQPDHVLQIAWRARHRLFRLQTRLRGRGKPANVATVATARDLACFLWAATVSDRRPDAHLHPPGGRRAGSLSACAFLLWAAAVRQSRPLLEPRPAGDEETSWGYRPPHIRLTDRRS